MNKNLYQRKGFTIIEVVLVLAIAALIILMVFIAWPALQRGQRDQARRQDVGLVGTAIGTYKANHRGEIPKNRAELATAMGTQETNFYGNSDIAIATIAGTNLTVGGTVAGATPPTGTVVAGTSAASTNVLLYVPTATCDGTAAKAGGGSRQAVLLYQVEGNGTPEAQCEQV